MNNGTPLTAADVAAVTRNDGNGMFGNDWAWIIILLLFGYGGRGFVGGGGGAPCATQADVRAATDMQTTISKLDGITNGISDATYALSTSMNNGFHGVDRGLCDISHQISDCCCGTKQAISDVKYTVATEACETRHAMANNTRDIIDNANANSRAILDALNANYIRTLEQENNSLRLSASQSAQNAALMAAMDANKAEILRRVAPTPSPAWIVPNPNCCYQYGVAPVSACGGCGGFSA